ncbi:MAG: hypothetical protein II812_07450 [Prevotella sp.]|nr:hypothetical protein [Prevotella sp.]MBQ4444954.1 hypothetical protein [Prevotella sp.]
MDRLLSYFIRLIVWFSRFAKPLSHIGLFKYDEWSKGKPIKTIYQYCLLVIVTKQ